MTLRADRSGEDYRAALVSALEEVERLIRLAEDLLLLSSSTAGPESPRARVELEPLVLEVADIGARLGKDRGVAVRVGPVAPLAVLGDVGALRRVVLNLVENWGEVHATPGGRVDLSVVADECRRVCSCVEDYRPGHRRQADAARVFEAFVRLDAARVRGDRRQRTGPGHRAVDRDRASRDDRRRARAGRRRPLHDPAAPRLKGALLVRRAIMSGVTDRRADGPPDAAGLMFTVRRAS